MARHSMRIEGDLYESEFQTGFIAGMCYQIGCREVMTDVDAENHSVTFHMNASERNWDRAKRSISAYLDYCAKLAERYADEEKKDSENEKDEKEEHV